MWLLLDIFDILSFIPCALTVAYMLFFALASTRNPVLPPKARGRMGRFLFVIFAHEADEAAIETVESVIAQDYNEQDFDITVVSVGNKPVTNLRLKQYRLSLLCAELKDCSKAAMLHYAASHTNRLKLYDMAVMLEADNTVGRDFLQKLNMSLRSGYRFVQAHRMASSRDTAIEIMEATFEEINNSIFRRGHVAAGMSSGLAASGMALDYQWLRANIGNLVPGNEVKGLEALLLRKRIFIEYTENAIVYDRKAHSRKAFNTQRSHWITTQRKMLAQHLRFLPAALLTKNYDYADKIMQWLLVPRTLLVIICLFFSVAWPLIYWSMALKWWIALMLLFLAFALATPDYLVDDAWVKSYRELPRLILNGIIQQLPRRLPTFKMPKLLRRKQKDT